MSGQIIRSLTVAVALIAFGARARAAELVFGGGNTDCTRLVCPRGVNCDILIRPACLRCTADSSKSFVIRCADDSCSSFGPMNCEPARAAAPSAEPVPVECREAKINVDWVITHDEGAKRRYAEFRRQGNSPIDAVIAAQAHNRHAQDTIRLCSGWASTYLAAKGMGSGHMSPSPSGPPASKSPSSCSVDATEGCAGCKITCPEGDVATCYAGAGAVGGIPPQLSCIRQSSCRCYPRR